MENCLYHKKMLCTFDLKDKDGYYYEDQVLGWKEAAAERKLTCVECGAPVYLAAGPIKEPYFAHYDTHACDYGSGQESEELKKGKRLLYHILRRSFPEAMVEAHHRMENGSYTTLFCTVGDYSLAVDYRLQNTSLEKFRERDNYYLIKHITPLYVMGKRLDKRTEQPDWYQTLLHKSMGYLAFLDTQKETLTFLKNYSYRLGKERKFQNCIRTYPIREVLMDCYGTPLCDFTEQCHKLEEDIEKEKQSYHKQQKQLAKLMEEKRLLEEQERERMEAFRRARQQEEKSSSQKSELPSDRDITAMGLNPAIYRKCLALIAEGNSQLVAVKYLEAILDKR